jgi:hypothetical protein
LKTVIALLVTNYRLSEGYVGLLDTRVERTGAIAVERTGIHALSNGIDNRV